MKPFESTLSATSPPTENTGTPTGFAHSAEAEAAARRHISKVETLARANRGWLGAWMLFRRELARFMKVAGQTIVSPVLTTLLWFIVFGYSLGSRLDEIQGVPYVDFLVPGLIMLNLINNAFLNTGFSLFISKVHGSVVDVLLTPLTPLQIIFGYIAASLLRAMIIGGLIWLVAGVMGAGTLHNPAFTLVFMILTSTAFALFGLVVAILADDFDHINLFPAFLIMPLTFLGGVFYSLDMLPSPWDTVSLANPILYMVNGLRYGMTGVSDVPVGLGLLFVTMLAGLFGLVAYYLLASGKKLRE